MRRLFRIAKKLTESKNNRRIILLAAAGILLLVIGSLPQKDNKKLPSAPETDIEEIRRKKETELKRFLEKIDGVSDVYVMISYKNCGSKSYGRNVKTASSQSEENTDSQIAMQRTGGDEKPVEERRELPEIKGITVIAAGSAQSAETILRAASGASGAEIHKIEVIINEKK